MIPTEWVMKSVIGLAFAACFCLIGMGAHKVFSDRTIAKLKLSMAEERTAAAQKLAQAEADARTKEQQWATRLREKDDAYALDIGSRDRAVAALTATSDGLRNKLAAYIRNSQATAGTGPAASDVQHRIETLGVLLGEADELASESAVAADTLRNELALCRGYAQAVSH